MLPQLMAGSSAVTGSMAASCAAAAGASASVWRLISELRALMRGRIGDDLRFFPQPRLDVQPLDVWTQCFAPAWAEETLTWGAGRVGNQWPSFRVAWERDGSRAKNATIRPNTSIASRSPRKCTSAK